MAEHGRSNAPDGPRHRLGSPAAVIGAVRPSLQHSAFAIVVTLSLVVAGVALGASIPRLVKSLLYKDTTPLIIAFVLVLIADPIVNYLAHLRATKLSLHAGYGLRTRVFRGVAATSPLSSNATVRANALARCGPDVDRVEHAFESLIVGGISGVLRIVAALIFLDQINRPAALLMAAAVPTFFVVQTRLSGRLVAADRARNATADHLATVVDESVSATPTIRGLRVGTWVRLRFSSVAHHLDEDSYAQMRLDARLHFGTRVVALIGLGAITAFGVRSADSAGDLIAALLYIELAILGLESLPPTLRALHQGEASAARLAPLLQAVDAPSQAPDDADAAIPAPTGAATIVVRAPDGTDHDIAPGAWVAVVDPTGHAVRWIGGLAEPPDGQVLIDGIPAPLALRSGVLTTVDDAARCVDASVLDHLRATAPALSSEGAVALLARVGLAHLVDLPDGGLEAPLGVQGSALSAGERHRLLVAMALAGEPAALVTGRLRPLADPDVASVLIAELRRNPLTLITGVDTAPLAEAADIVVFVTESSWHVGTHNDLLIGVPAYVAQWQRRETDLAELGALAAAGPLEREALRDRMVTERYEPGDTIYREGAPADRVVFVVSGQVEILSGAGTEAERRLAVLGPGNACGDLRLTPDERRAETARALDVAVVRTLGRAVWEAGMSGLLRTDVTERRVLATIVKRGALDLDAVIAHLPDEAPDAVRTAASALLREGALRQRASGELTIGASTRRTATSTLSADLLDDLAGS